MNNKTNRKHTFFSATRLKDFFIPVHWHLCFLAFVGIFGIAVAGYILTAEAACPQGDNLLKTKGMESAVEAYAFCAIGENEENAQFRLAQYYQNKKNATPQEKMKMLFYYHLADENGTANARTPLAKPLLPMVSNDAERAIVAQYMNQMATMMKNRGMLFKGELLHPYALLLLAAESPDQKWYYPTTQKSSAEARILSEQYKIDPARKREILRQASLWKQQKMKETAKEVLTVDEYKAFMQAVYPEKGRADAFERGQAVGKLKEKVKEYLR